MRKFSNADDRHIDSFGARNVLADFGSRAAANYRDFAPSRAKAVEAQPVETATTEIAAIATARGEATTAAPVSNGLLADGTPDWIVTTQALSNDPSYTGGQLFGMYGDLTTPANQFGSQAGEAWAAGFTGSTKVAVGVIDSGIDYRHQDLFLNIWLNQAEISTTLRSVLTDTDGDALITFRDLNQSANAAHVTDFNANGRIDAGDLLADARWENGTDQDGNGYRDDLIGWDFVNNDNDPFDDNNHGTHVAGTIGAIGGNGVGVVGVNWEVQMVGLKFLSAGGSGSTSGAIAAIDYFTGMARNSFGVNFVATNNSWGGGGYSASLQAAIDRGAAQDILFVAAAGNGGADQVGDNNDVVQNYPSNYSTVSGAGYEAVVAVASITSTGARSGFSNFGRNTVDLGAPGSSVRSTLPNDTYGSFSGTSMATPHVAGAIALYAAANPGATAAQIRAALLAAALPTVSLDGITVTGGRLDVGTLLGGAAPPPEGVVLNGTNGNDVLNGTAFADVLNGLGGNDTLDGKAGADAMSGGTGNDIFFVENVGDTVVELAGGGTDTVRALLNYTLGDAVEILYLDGAANLNGTGNGASNWIYGNGGANTLVGLGGNDTLDGKAGNDRLEGGDGADRLIGGAGTDVLLGGAGNDVFDFNSVAEIGLGALRDSILDFATGDRIDLSSIDASTTAGGNNAFAFIGAAAFSGVAGQLRAVLSGGSTIVQGDTNGDRTADFELLLSAFVTPLQPADFIA